MGARECAESLRRPSTVTTTCCPTTSSVLANLTMRSSFSDAHPERPDVICRVRSSKGGF